MAARMGIELDAIEVARKSVTALSLSHQATARVARKHAVKELFATLMVAWEADVPFDKMAEALNNSGIDITTETLRKYFFDLKTARDLKAESKEHERAVERLRKEREAKRRADDLEHARAMSAYRAEISNSAHAASVESAHQIATQAVQSARRGAASIGARSGSSVPGGPLPVRPTGLRPGGNGPVQAKPQRSEIVSGPANPQSPMSADSIADETMAQQVSASAPAELEKTDIGEVAAKTLEELARTSQGQQESSFTENLVLRNGFVWFESGKPFDGVLSPRTLHTLRTVGKVIAPTIGRTAKDFVQMRHEL